MNKADTLKILLVDDEPNVLNAHRRTIGRVFPASVAEGGQVGLAMIEKEGPFAVIVTDMRMPGMNGIEFINAAREKSRDSVYLMLTGNADQQTAVDAINSGRVFRFLNKPCTPEQLEGAIRDALRQHEMATAERVLLRDTLTGSIRLMVDALELADPEVGSVQASVKSTMHDLCAHFKIGFDWQFVVAGSVCLVGLMGNARGKESGIPSDATLQEAAALGSRLLLNIPRMASVSNILSRQREPGLLPLNLDDHSRENLDTIAARFVKAGVDLGFALRSGLTPTAAIEQLERSLTVDPRITEALRVVQDQLGAHTKTVVKEIKTADLKAGMILETDLMKADGQLLLSRGQPVSELAAVNLRSQANHGLLPATVTVRVKVE